MAQNEGVSPEDARARGRMRIDWFHDCVSGGIGFTIRVPGGCSPNPAAAEPLLWALWQMLYAVVMRVCGNAYVGTSFKYEDAVKMLKEFQRLGITVENMTPPGAGREGQ